MTVIIPLSQIKDPKAFAADLEAHRAALEAHRSGPHGVAAPVAHPLLDALVARVHRGDPLPDAFVLVPYEIHDDTPHAPAVATALQVLRETITP